MRHALLLTAVLTAVFLLAERILGVEVAAALGFGTVMVIGAINALTFLWLWWARTTPLALGMSCSWMGQTALSIWWEWSMPTRSRRLGRGQRARIPAPVALRRGGALHIAVMQRSMDLGRVFLLWPILAIFVVAAVTATAF